MEDETDLQLKRLAVGTQKHPAGSPSRQTALTKLMGEIYRSGRLGNPQKGSWLPGVYEDLHSEAVLKTVEYIRQNIDTYDSERPLMGWVNWILKHRFFDATRKYQKYMNQIERKTPSFDDLEKIMQPSQSNDTNTGLRELIEQDPDGIFRGVALRNRPDITWQDIALARLDDETWKKISENFGVSPTAISSLFARNLRDFRDYFRNNL